jgi:branched-chain amino acid transport system ATP-binding protein
MENVLEVQGITKRFGGVVAVSNFTAQIKPGEIVGIIGPNGAGKTTILNLISGIYRPDSGSIVLEGKELSKLSRWQIAQAGIARTFQHIRLFDSLTAIENVMTIMSNVERLKEKKLKEKSEKLMLDFGWTDAVDCMVRDLPYAKKRRIELLCALSLNPRLLMLDEPAAGLNLCEIQDLIEYVSKINKEYKIPIVLIEHRLEVIMSLCSSVYVVSFGQTIAHGNTAEIWKDPVVISAYLGEGAY